MPCSEPKPGSQALTTSQKEQLINASRAKPQENESGPWQKVHLDFYGPLPSGEHLLVCIDLCIDLYSRYPNVEIVRSTKAASVMHQSVPIENIPPGKSRGIFEVVKSPALRQNFPAKALSLGQKDLYPWGVFQKI